MAGVDVLATAMIGANAQFISQLYAKWVEAPNAVDPDFAALFAALNDEAKAVLTDASGASWAPNPPGGIFEAPPAAESRPAAKPAQSTETAADARAADVGFHPSPAADPAPTASAVTWKRNSIRLDLKVSGHHADLDPKSYGFTDADMDREIYIGKDLGFESGAASLHDIINRLRVSYCGFIGLEFMHIQDPGPATPGCKAGWRAPPGPPSSATPTRPKILRQLTEADSFENFCQRRYVGTKRFGLEGGETTIPALHAVIETAADHGVSEIAIGMPHRGRLNTLVNIVKKPFDRFVQRIRRRKCQAERRAGLRRREIPSRHLDRHRHQRQPGASLAAAQPVAS